MMEDEIGNNEKELVPPVKEGDLLKNVEVISAGKKNDGVIKHEGYIIFVPDCDKGDIISIIVEKVLPKFGIGKKTNEDDEQ